MRPLKESNIHLTNIKSKFRSKLFLIFMGSTCLFSIPFGIFLHDAFMGYHFMKQNLYGALVFAVLAFGPWILVIFLMDKLIYQNGILTVYTIWGFKKRSFGRDEIEGWSEEYVKDEWQLKLYLANNKTYTIYSSVYANYAEFRKVLINKKSKIKDSSKSRNYVAFAFVSGGGLLFLVMSIFSFVKMDKGIDPFETVSIQSHSISIKKESSRSGKWIEIYLKDYPGFCFQVEDVAYRLIDDNVLEDIHSGDNICLEIAKTDYQHCQKDLHSGYIWKEGDGEEKMSVIGVKSNVYTYLSPTDYWIEKEAAAKEIPWTFIIMGMVFFFGGFVFYPFKKSGKRKE